MNESFNKLKKTITHRLPKNQKTHTRSISMNWALKLSEKQTKPKNQELQGDVLFTLPSEKEHDKETARFEIDTFKDKSNRKPHTRIYSMYNFQNNIKEMKPSPRIDINENKFENSSVNTCLICFDRTPDSVFMECGHGGFLIKIII